MASRFMRSDPLKPEIISTESFSKSSVNGAAAPSSALGVLPPLAGVVAVVGCDGTGKTTLVADLVSILRQQGPAERRYMGLVSGEAGEKIKRLPVVGLGLDRYLAVRVRRAQDMNKRLPGTFSAIVMYLFSLWRVMQLRRLIRSSRTGTTIVAERYPQAEVPGFHYDGPGLAVGRAKGWLARNLARQEQKLYERMAEQRPSLILRLTIDPETAYARKPDHPLSELRDKVATMPRINYNGSAITEIDSRLPYPLVLEAALRAIDHVVTADRKR